MLDSGANRNEKLRILGVDPGMNTTGYGIIDVVRGGPVLVEGGIIHAPSKQPLEKRLSAIFTGMQELLDGFSPDAVSIEEVYTHYERPRVAVMMGHARGVVCLAAALNQVPVFSYAATHIKASLTGNGHAGKEQIQRMVQVRLSIETPPKPLDVTDALAAALCHMMRGTAPDPAQALGEL